MALNKDVLGNSLYTAASEFNDTDISDIEQARKDFWNAIAEAVINHFKESGVVVVPGTGLVAGPYTVTGSANGKIE